MMVEFSLSAHCLIIRKQVFFAVFFFLIALKEFSILHSCKFTLAGWVFTSIVYDSTVHADVTVTVLVYIGTEVRSFKSKFCFYPH